MAINLGGVAAWAASDQLEPGAYIAKAVTVESTQSKNGNEQIQVDWRVLNTQYAGADQRDWITFTENAMGRVVQVIEACGQEVPQEDFKSYAELRDWVAKMLENGAITEMVIRLEPGNKDPEKMFPKVAGYRRPDPASIPSSNGAAAAANGATGTCTMKDCDEPAVDIGFCQKHKTPF